MDGPTHNSGSGSRWLLGCSARQLSLTLNVRVSSPVLPLSKQQDSGHLSLDSTHTGVLEEICAWLLSIKKLILAEQHGLLENMMSQYVAGLLGAELCPNQSPVLWA